MFVKVTFPYGYHGTTNHRSKLEFPPSPLRFFQSLTAAAYRGLDPEKQSKVEKFLDYLSTLKISEIHVGRMISNPNSNLDNFVPENNKTGSDDGLYNVSFADFHSRKPKPIVFCHMRHNCVYYKFDGEFNKSLMSELLEKILFVGTSKSRVKCSLVESPEENNLIQYLRNDENTGESFETFYPNIRKDLNKCHSMGIMLNHRPTDHYCRYHQSQEDFNYDRIYFKITEGHEFLDITHTEIFAHRFQLKLFESNTHREADRIILNTDKNDSNFQAAYVPLPFVRHERADGLIRTMMVMVRKDSPENQKMAFEKALSEFKDFSYNGQTIRFEICNPKNLPLSSNPGRLFQPSRTWSTATPVGIRWSKNHNDEKSVESIRQYFQYAIGNRAILTGFNIRHGRYSVNGSQVAGRFLTRTNRRSDGTTRQKYYLTHMTATFDREVDFPIVVGRGRNYGMGLFVPIHHVDHGVIYDKKGFEEMSVF